MKEEEKIKSVSRAQVQPQKQKKGCFNLRNCCFCCLGIFLAVILSFLILLTLSGLVRIPLLSPLLYGDGPKPSRTVTLQQVDDKYFENLFKTAGETNQNQVLISENVLSFLINDFANKENNVLVAEKERTKGSQLAVEDGYTELFYKPLSPRTTLTIKIIPSQTGYKASKIKIGKLRVPVFAANFFFSRFLDFSSMYDSSGIKSLKLEKGRILMEIDPAFFKGNNPPEAPVPFIPQN